MVRKKLSLKQLYAFSIMNWELYLRNLEKASDEKCCSFCRDVGKRDDEYGNLENGFEITCIDCKINPIICVYNEESEIFGGIYKEFSDSNSKMHEAIYKLIRALKIEYAKN